MLPSSCHPEATTTAIPYSLALRIVRTCTNQGIRDLRLKELNELLQARNYPETLIDSALNKERKIPRKVALYKIRKKSEEKRPVFALKYDPRLPPLGPIQAKHWRAMIAQDQHLAEVFKQPPLIAYRRQKNLQDFLIKSKVPSAIQRYPTEKLKAWQNVGNPVQPVHTSSLEEKLKLTKEKHGKSTGKLHVTHLTVST